MLKLIAATSIVILGITGSAWAQTNMGTDASGRFDGSPPLGTSPEVEQSTGLSIPLDSIETGSTTSGTIHWTRCPEGGKIAARTRNSGASISRACLDNGD
jgi:hypothetical protein